MRLKSVILLTTIVALTIFYSVRKPWIKYSKTEILMDTVITIEVYGKDPEMMKIAVSKAFERMKNLEKKLSNYIPSSEISLINRYAGEHPVKVSQITYSFLKKAIDLSNLTDGYLDITIGALTSLWGFTKGKPHLPKNEEIKKALKLKGINCIELNEGNHTVFIKRKGIKIDVGAVAKGFIVDEAVKYLKMLGIKRGVVNAGGDLRFIGLKNGKEKWTVGIRDPYSKNPQTVIKKVKVGNWAIATSGDYERFFLKDGKRYCHLINPFTGYPEDYFRSVSVEAENAFIADGLATAIFVMGKDYTKFLPKFSKIKHFKVFTVKNLNRREHNGKKNP